MMYNALHITARWYSTETNYHYTDRLVIMDQDLLTDYVRQKASDYQELISLTAKRITVMGAPR